MGRSPSRSRNPIAGALIAMLALLPLLYYGLSDANTDQPPQLVIQPQPEPASIAPEPAPEPEPETPRRRRTPRPESTPEPAAPAETTPIAPYALPANTTARIRLVDQRGVPVAGALAYIEQTAFESDATGLVECPPERQKPDWVGKTSLSAVILALGYAKFDGDIALSEDVAVQRLWKRTRVSGRVTGAKLNRNAQMMLIQPVAAMADIPAGLAGRFPYKIAGRATIDDDKSYTIEILKHPPAAELVAYCGARALRQTPDAVAIGMEGVALQLTTASMGVLGPYMEVFITPGAEIELDYHIPEPWTLIATLKGLKRPGGLSLLVSDQGVVPPQLRSVGIGVVDSSGEVVVANMLRRTVSLSLVTQSMESVLTNFHDLNIPEYQSDVRVELDLSAYRTLLVDLNELDLPATYDLELKQNGQSTLLPRQSGSVLLMVKRDYRAQIIVSPASIGRGYRQEVPPVRTLEIEAGGTVDPMLLSLNTAWQDIRVNFDDIAAPETEGSSRRASREVYANVAYQRLGEREYYHAVNVDSATRRVPFFTSGTYIIWAMSGSARSRPISVNVSLPMEMTPERKQSVTTLRMQPALPITLLVSEEVKQDITLKATTRSSITLVTPAGTELVIQSVGDADLPIRMPVTDASGLPVLLPGKYRATGDLYTLRYRLRASNIEIEFVDGEVRLAMEVTRIAHVIVVGSARPVHITGSDIQRAGVEQMQRENSRDIGKSQWNMGPLEAGSYTLSDGTRTRVITVNPLEEHLYLIHWSE